MSSVESAVPEVGEVEKSTQVRRISECFTNEQRLERVLQEIGFKAVKGYQIVEQMLLLSGFDKEKITSAVIATYNILLERDRNFLLDVCLKKSGDDTITNGKLKQMSQELENLTFAIMQLDKSARILAKNVAIERHIIKHRWKIIAVVLGLLGLLYLFSDKANNQEEDGKVEKKPTIPQLYKSNVT